MARVVELVPLSFTVDREDSTAYLRLSPDVGTEVEVDQVIHIKKLNMNFDFDAKGKLVSIEFLKTDLLPPSLMEMARDITEPIPGRHSQPNIFYKS